MDDSFDYDGLPRGYYDVIARRGSGVQSAWHRLKFRFLARRLAEALPGGSPPHVVDIGCGPGTFLGVLREELGVTGVGVDLSAEQVGYAEETYGGPALRFLTSDAASDDVAAEVARADVVTMIEVIEHIPLRRARHLLQRLHSAMRPGATLLLSTPNYLSAWPVLERAVSMLTEVNYEEHHVLHFNRLKLENMLDVVGFVDVRVRSFLHVSPFVSGVLGEGLGRVALALEERALVRGGPLLWALATRGADKRGGRAPRGDGGHDG